MKVTKAHKAVINYNHKFNIDFDIPAGLPVTSQTSLGWDENYNFLNDFFFST